jgi:isopentenyl-diphosphate delta-isomerase
MSEEIIIPAIADDGTLFPIEKMEAHRIAQQHLAISVFVFSGTKLLIQQRAKGKYHCPGRWANTCCSHPHWQESVEDAARAAFTKNSALQCHSARPPSSTTRRTWVVASPRTSGCTCSRAKADQTTLKTSLNPEEVAAVRWVEVADLPRLLAEQPDSLCPWFAIYIRRWNELNLGL